MSRLYIGFIFILFFYSCKNILSKEYPCQIGGLLFENFVFQCGKVFLGSEGKAALQVYNPTDSMIKIQGVEKYSNITFFSQKDSTSNWLNQGIEIYPKTCDTLYAQFKAIDTNYLGQYRKEIRFQINGVEQYQHLVLSANILEHFDSLEMNGIVDIPSIDLNVNEHDFGKMREGERKETIVYVKNNGQKPLIIRKIESSCGCMTPKLSGKIILPGEETEMKVIFRARGLSGRQNKTIRLYSNDPQYPVTTFRIKCFIDKTVPRPSN